MCLLSIYNATGRGEIRIVCHLIYFVISLAFFEDATLQCCKGTCVGLQLDSVTWTGYCNNTNSWACLAGFRFCKLSCRKYLTRGGDHVSSHLPELELDVVLNEQPWL